VRLKKTALLKFFVGLNIFTQMQDGILHTPLQQLDLSASFKEMAFNQNFKTLEDVLNWPVNVLLQHDGFTYHHYQELRNLLKEKNSLHLLKTKAL
jgi:hypothetical protein